MPVERLRYVGLSHFEADECGALNDFLAVAPTAVPLCGQVAAMVSVGDVPTGRHARWPRARPSPWANVACAGSDTPTFPTPGSAACSSRSTPHDAVRRSLHQGGADTPPVTEKDILARPRAFRAQMDYYAALPRTRATLERLAAAAPTTLGLHARSAWKGDGGKLLRALADSVERADRQ